MGDRFATACCGSAFHFRATEVGASGYSDSSRSKCAPSRIFRSPSGLPILVSVALAPFAHATYILCFAGAQSADERRRHRARHRQRQGPAGRRTGVGVFRIGPCAARHLGLAPWCVRGAPDRWCWACAVLRRRSGAPEGTTHYATGDGCVRDGCGGSRHDAPPAARTHADRQPGQHRAAIVRTGRYAPTPLGDGVGRRRAAGVGARPRGPGAAGQWGGHAGGRPAPAHRRPQGAGSTCTGSLSNCTFPTCAIDASKVKRAWYSQSHNSAMPWVS